MLTTCPQCHRNVPGDRPACLYCGARLPPPARPAAGAPMHPEVPALVKRAQDHIAQHELDLAVDCLDAALEREPTRLPVLWHNRSLLLADLGRGDEAIAGLDRLLTLQPGNENARSLRARIVSDPHAVLPPGGPGPTSLESAAGGDRDALFGARVMASPRYGGAAQIAIASYLVEAPDCARDAAGHPWAFGGLAETGVRFHFITRDRTGVVCRDAGGAPELPDSRVEDEYLQAFGAILVRRRLERVVLVASAPFAARTVARIGALNEALARAGAKATARLAAETIIAD